MKLNENIAFFCLVSKEKRKDIMIYVLPKYVFRDLEAFNLMSKFPFKFFQPMKCVQDFFTCFSFAYIWIKDFVSEKKIKIKKLGDPIVQDYWII